jgi:hypothetical protein
MSSHSKSALSYLDVHQAFEAAGRSGGITLTFDTPAAAVTWNGRANAYRVLLRRQNEAAGREFASEFDHLMVRRRKGENLIRIEPRGFNFVATTSEGEVIDFDRQTLDKPVLTPYQKSRAEADIDSFLDSIQDEVKK